ncbi:hypothetical protein [Sulfitobacter sp. R18_1]|uniref:hypothetical protein n=1 Tax=Sulfitobacter sp. R18_1 TaxID=2821104 RepID=UPI001ADD1C63|nr:hypothetical protein [Sulfitobacter sp. R18_1]MBO9428726.1 hypothetical protein [Sulfitobacter sp. R18_1]
MNNNSPERLEAVDLLMEDCFEDSGNIEGIVFQRTSQMSKTDLESHMTNHYGADSIDMLEGWDSIRDFVRSDMLDSAKSDEDYLKSVIQDYVGAMTDDEVFEILPQRRPEP